MPREAVPEQIPAVPVEEKEKGAEELEIEKEDIGRMSKLLSAGKDFLWQKVIPAALEGSHKAERFFNGAIDYTKKAVDNVVPAVSEAVTGFILPEHASRVVNKAIEFGTKATTWSAKTLAKAGLNFFTLGAPAWADGFRQHLAVTAAAEPFKKAKGAKEVTALSYIDHLKDKDVQDALSKYYDLRAELAKAREAPSIDEAEIKRLSARIANFEVNYKDNADFTTLKSILEKGRDFVQDNQALVEQLSSDAADRMIERVESYYQERLGEIVGGKVEVEGKLLEIFKSPENRRELLKKRIKERLNEVFENELTEEETLKKMEGVYSELISSFGVYRKYLKAAIYSLLRLAPVPTYAEGEEASFFGEVTKGVKRGLAEVGVTTAQAKDAALAADGMVFAPTVGEYVDSLGNTAKAATGRLAEAGTVQVGEAVIAAKDWVMSAAGTIKDMAVEKFNELVDSAKEGIKSEIRESVPVEKIAETARKDMAAFATEPTITKALRVQHPIAATVLDYLWGK